MHSLNNFPAHPDELLSRIQFWVPPVLPFEPIKSKPNSSLKIAVIVTDRLYHGLKYEGELLILTPENWEMVLEHAKPDMLLVESCWKNITSHWYLSQTVETDQSAILKDMLAGARSRSIPTVYWNTQDFLYNEHYKEFARQFDFVFCADDRVVNDYIDAGIEAEKLGVAIQPAIHNPFRHHKRVNALNIGVLFDGLTDLLRSEESIGPLLKKVQAYGLGVIDSCNQVFSSKCAALSGYESSILGCVTQSSRITSLKYAKSALSFGSSSQTRTIQQWIALETVACRVPMIYRGQLPDNDIRQGIVHVAESDDDALSLLDNFKANDLHRERCAQAGWRSVYQQHTFSHRLRTMCDRIGINHDWIEYPGASAITPTYRSENLQHCVDTFDRQLYPNKELVIVYNASTESLPGEFSELEKCRDDIHVHHVPHDVFAGACLNIGNMSSSGDYCFRMDDDDFYGENYIGDMMLHLRSIDADIFGKPPGYVYFEGLDKTYKRANKTPQLCVLSTEECKKNTVWLGGNTISGKKEFLDKCGYHDNVFGTADTAFIVNAANLSPVIVSFDSLNMVACRRDDPSTHTWNMPAKKLKKDALFICDGSAELMV